MQEEATFKGGTEKEGTLQDEFRRHLDELQEEERAADRVTKSLIVDGKPICETEDHANRIVRAMAEVDEERRRIKEQYEARLARLNSKANSLAFLFEDKLADWVSQNLKGKKKSILFEDGTAGYRKNPGGIKTESMDTLKEFCKTHAPQALNFDRAPVIIEEVKKLEETSGVPCPGRTKTEDEDRFYIKFARLDGRKELKEEEDE